MRKCILDVMSGWFVYDLCIMYSSLGLDDAFHSISGSSCRSHSVASRPQLADAAGLARAGRLDYPALASADITASPAYPLSSSDSLEPRIEIRIFLLRTKKKGDHPT